MILILREQSKARQRISQCIKTLTLALSAGGIQTEGAECIGYIIMVICIPILECVYTCTCLVAIIWMDLCVYYVDSSQTVLELNLPVNVLSSLCVYIYC